MRLNLGSQSSRARASVKSGQRRVGSSSGRPSNRISLRDSVISSTACAIENCELIGVADVHRKMLSCLREAQNALFEVIHITKTSRLVAVTEYCQRLAAQGLHHEVADYSAIAGVQPGAISVEDA